MTAWQHARRPTRARKLNPASTNLLAGRALPRVMLPLLPGELGEDFDIERALVRNLPGFGRVLPIAALFHGQVLNTAGLGQTRI